MRTYKSKLVIKIFIKLTGEIFTNYDIVPDKKTKKTYSEVISKTQFFLIKFLFMDLSKTDIFQIKKGQDNFE